ncbi:mitochondrial ribosomal protein S10 [Oratosquilla oratoria]|uniref:mitochondrial ribosomal protein S10 n=1 Tax=Oratosquilla oratoria TaxID=337810 RepID=UPI003F765874
MLRRSGQFFLALSRKNATVQRTAVAAAATHLYTSERRNQGLLHLTSGLHTTVPTSNKSIAVQEDELDRLYSLVEVECRGHDKAVLQSYLKFATTAANHLSIHIQDISWPQKHLRRWTLLKSVHIYKKHRVQYEVRSHFAIMSFARLTSSTADTFLEYIQRNLPEGVALKITKHEIQKLPLHVTQAKKED